MVTTLCAQPITQPISFPNFWTPVLFPGMMNASVHDKLARCISICKMCSVHTTKFPDKYHFNKQTKAFLPVHSSTQASYPSLSIQQQISFTSLRHLYPTEKYTTTNNVPATTTTPSAWRQLKKLRLEHMGFCTTLPPSFFSLASSAPKHTHRESRRKRRKNLTNDHKTDVIMWIRNVKVMSPHLQNLFQIHYSLYIHVYKYCVIYKTHYTNT